jgi:hypothetical protein
VVNKGRRSADLSDEERCPNSARVVLERHAPHTGSRHSAAPGFTVSEKDGQSRDRANPAEPWRLRRDLNQEHLRIFRPSVHVSNARLRRQFRRRGAAD